MSVAAASVTAPESRTVKLGDIVKLHYGKPLPDSERSPAGKVPVYGANGIKDYGSKSLCSGPALIIGRKGSAGEITRVEGPFWPLDVTYYTSHDVHRLDFDYMAYALSMLDLPSLARGVKPGINRNDVYALNLQLPPLEEQKRIVGVLDQAFTALDRGRANAEANLADAQTLFFRIASDNLDAVAKNGRLVPVGSIAEHCLGKMLDKHKNKGVSSRYLRNLNVRWFEVNTSDVLEMKIEKREQDRYRVRRGDLLICEGGYPGRASIYDSDEYIYFQKALHRVRFDDAALAKVLMYWLYVEDKAGRLKSHFSGTGISHFTGQVLDRYAMPVASRAQNAECVRVIEECRQLTAVVERRYVRQLADLADLRQALLEKAFAGELT